MTCTISATCAQPNPLKEHPEGMWMGAASGDTAAPLGCSSLGILTIYSQTEKKNGVIQSFQIVDKESGELLNVDQVQLNNGSVELQTAYNQESADLEGWMMKQAARRLLMETPYRPVSRRISYSELIPAPSNGAPYFLSGVGRLGRFLIQPDIGVTVIDSGELAYYTPIHKKAKYRVINCMRDRQSSSESPEVWQANISGRCNLRKVIVCGSLWTCIHCSDKILRARRSHIRAVYDAFLKNEDSDCLMATFTFPHGISDHLPETFEMMKLARETMRKSHGFQALMMGQIIRKVFYPAKLKFLGHISATEMTHGLTNGWHPHLHELFFFDQKIENIDALRHQLFVLWAAACEKVGLPAPQEFWLDRKTGELKPIGVDLRRAYSADEYITKFSQVEGRGRWGLENELTSSSRKIGRSGSRSPFQILHDYTFSENDKDKHRDGQLFKEYAAATLGKHQLEFSKTLIKNLKDRGVDVRLLAELESSDSKLAEAQEQDSTCLGTLNDDDFTALNLGEKHGFNGMHGIFLTKCKRDGLGFALVWLRALHFYPKRLDDFNDSFCPF